MLKTGIRKKRTITLLFCVCCALLLYPKYIFAHEGHDHWNNTPITIKKSTVAHLQSILDSYNSLYKKLIEKDIQDIPLLAQNIMDAAQQGVQTEKKGEGRYMMEHIYLHAMSLKKVEIPDNVKESFKLISSELFPFFVAWPMQLKQNGLCLYYCKDDCGYWFQTEGSDPVCPYSSGKLPSCSNIENAGNK